jgi:uncharacterized repeat protein (TIGR01451 family)
MADLSVTKRSDLTSVRVGDTMTYTVTVTNNGPGTANAVVLADNVSASLTGVQFSINNGASWQPWPGTFTLGTLVRGASVTALFRGTVASTASGSISSTASVRSANVDPLAINDNSSLAVAVAPAAPAATGTPQISLTKNVYPRVAYPCCSVTYTIKIANTGTGDATDITITDIPSNELCNVQYSLDCGATWLPWPGTLQPGIVPSCHVFSMLIRGIVLSNAVCPIVSTTEASFTTPKKEAITKYVTCTVPVDRRRLLRL